MMGVAHAGDSVDSTPSHPTPPRPFQPLVGLTLGWIVGTVAGRAEAGWIGPGIAAIVLLLMAWYAQRAGRMRIAIASLALASAAVAAAWWPIRQPQFPPHHLLHVLEKTEGSILVDVEGTVGAPPQVRAGRSGEMGQFGNQTPYTTFVLRVDRVHSDSKPLPAIGGLMVRLRAADQRIGWGDRVRCQGWISALRPTMNPGEFDYRAMMHDRDIVGRLTLVHQGNWQLIEPAREAMPWWQYRHAQLVGGITSALDRGLPADTDPGTRALISAVVLGQRGPDLAEVSTAFRRTGLAHLLSISGLHLGVIAAGTWFIVLALTGRPRRAATVALALTVVYLLIVPIRVPILRAGIMSAIFCLAAMSGLRLRTASVMALACLILLIWRPGDLFDPGFQLSFGVVAALLAFVSRVSRWIWSPPELEPTSRHGFRRVIADYMAVSLVAWLVAMPLVAYHFHLISPSAVLLSAVMLPFIAVMLWLGLLKIVVTWAWVSAGTLIGWPLVWVTQVVEWIVRRAAELPGAWLMLPAPTVLWTFVTSGVVILILSGWFSGRRIAAAACIALCGVWLVLPRPPTTPTGQDDAATVTMFAVGAGSCILVESCGETLMVDCGSAFYPNVVESSIGPALRSLDVRHIDTLLLTHPDLDHFSGTIDLIEAFGVGRVITTSTFDDEARAEPWTATAYLLRALGRRGVERELITAGWNSPLGDAHLEAIWPPNDIEVEGNNDGSIVLSIRAAGRRVLLTGDIQSVAMEEMLSRNFDMTADVTDLPHHGSFVPTGPDWLARVGPSIVLQSSAMSRLYRDRWEPTLRDVSRYVTARHGMVRLHIAPSGEMSVQTHHARPLPGPGSVMGDK